jgi:hypothetical protein
MELSTQSSAKMCWHRTVFALCWKKNVFKKNFSVFNS